MLPVARATITGPDGTMHTLQPQSTSNITFKTPLERLLHAANLMRVEANTLLTSMVQASGATSHAERMEVEEDDSEGEEGVPAKRPKNA
jgi:hypothetical protein